jgi:hypothetical protein
MIKCNMVDQCPKGKEFCCVKCNDKGNCESACMNHPMKCRLARGSELEKLKRG